jgi:hypothetical protein
MTTVATIAGGLVAAGAAFAGGLLVTPLFGRPATALPGDAVAHVSRTGQARPGHPDRVSGGHSAAASSRQATPTRKAGVRRSERPATGHTAGPWREHPVARHHGGTWWHEHPVARPTVAAPRTSPPPRGRAASGALHCSGSSVMLPENYVAIVSFLIGHGYTRLAAAGIAGNMWQESKGDPESVGTGGGGLIGFTPLPPGYVTGNPAVDLQTQLSAVLTYNQQWSQYIPALNAATSATQAADIYMNDFERPGIPAAANREAAAATVASACGF